MGGGGDAVPVRLASIARACAGGARASVPDDPGSRDQSCMGLPEGVGTLHSDTGVPDAAQSAVAHESAMPSKVWRGTFSPSFV